MNRNTITQTGNLPAGMQLFQDSMPLKVLDTKVIAESHHHGGKSALKVTGVFQRAGVVNANGRVYPREVLEEAVGSIQDDLKGRRVMGEFDHPPDAKIHMERISHLITNLWMEGDQVIGEAEVLEGMEPHGKNLKALLEAGVCVGISSRGVGDMKTTQINENECYEVLPGYSLITFDAVAEPSVNNSYLQTMTESRQRRFVAAKKFHETQLLEEVKKMLFGEKNA